MMQNGRATAAPPPPRDESMSSSALAVRAGHSIVRVQTQHITAMRVEVPRDLARVKSNTLFEAELMGEDFYYAWTVADKRSKTGESLISGTSVEGAMMMWNNWSNCTYEIDVVDETPTHWLLRAVALDLEKGVGTPRLFRQRKSQRVGKMDVDRAEDIAFQIGQSKAIRNALVRALPAWLVNEAKSTAENASVNKYRDVPKSIWDLTGVAEGYGVTAAELMAKAGKEFQITKHRSGKGFDVLPGAWLPVDIAKMYAIFRAIKTNDTTVEIEFRGAKPPASEDEQEKAEAPAGGQAAGDGVGFGGGDAGGSSEPADAGRFAGGDDRATKPVASPAAETGTEPSRGAPSDGFAPPTPSTTDATPKQRPRPGSGNGGQR